MKKTFATDYVNRQDVNLTSEIERFLDTLEDKLTALDKELRDSQRVTATDFQIHQNEMMDSPAPTDAKSLGIKVKDMDAMRRNYAVVQELMDVLQALDTTEARLRSAFPEEGSAKGPLADVARLRKSTVQRLNEAYAFLQSLGKGHAPKAFTEFAEKTNRIVEKSIVYLDSKSYIYLHEVAGAPTFSHYLQLIDCIDEDGTAFPNIFVVTSMQINKPPQFFLTVLQQFEPPSSALLTKEVKSMKDVVRYLHHLLVMDSFSNSLGAFPVPLLLKPSALRVEMFSAAQHINKVEVDDETGNLLFHLKPTVKSDDLIQKIWVQLQQDVKGLITATRSKLRIAKKDWGDHIVLTFFMLKPDNGPQATADDLDFFKDRFGLDDNKVKRILQIVNSSMQYLKGPKVSAGVDAAKETDGKGSEQEPNQKEQQVNREEPAQKGKSETTDDMEARSEEEPRDPRTPDTEGMTDKDVEFFAKGDHKTGSTARKLLGQIVQEVTDDVITHLKKATIEWQTAGSAVAAVARGQQLNAQAKQSLRTLGYDVVAALIAQALKDDMPHGLVAMLAHRGPQDAYACLVEAACYSIVHDEQGDDKQENKADEARFDAQMEVILKETLRLLAEEISQGEWEADEWSAAVKTSEHHTHYDGEMEQEEAVAEDAEASKETAAPKGSDWKVRFKYTDEEGNLSSAEIKVPNCTDTQHVKRIWETKTKPMLEARYSKRKDFKIERVTKAALANTVKVSASLFSKMQVGKSYLLTSNGTQRKGTVVAKNDQSDTNRFPSVTVKWINTK